MDLLNARIKEGELDSVFSLDTNQFNKIKAGNIFYMNSLIEMDISKTYYFA